jgi:hypothetical protein
MLHNSLDSTIQVNLYPKPEYCHGDYYKVSSIGSGYSPKFFDLISKNEEYLYYSDNYSISPQVLLGQIFDSVNLIVKRDTTITIKFNANSFQHYTQNIFTSSIIWTFRSYDGSQPTMGSNNIIHVHQFTFTVQIDSIR